MFLQARQVFYVSADTGRVERLVALWDCTLFGGWAGSLLFGVSLVKMPRLCFLVMVYNSISKNCILQIKHSCFIV